MFFDFDKKKNLFSYLHFYFLKKRPTRKIRQLLNLNGVLKQVKCQVKIKRFVESLEKILKSDFYKEEILSKKIDIKIVRACESGVHSELKLVDFLILNKKIKEKKIPITDKSKLVYIVGSRKPCINCRSIMNALNQNDSKEEIVYHDDVITKNRYKFKKPEFLSLDKFSFLNDIAKILSKSSYKSNGKRVALATPSEIISRSKSDFRKEILSHDNFPLDPGSNFKRVDGDLPISILTNFKQEIKNMLQMEPKFLGELENLIVDYKKENKITSNFCK